jgi:AraC family transcriptional regulator
MYSKRRIPKLVPTSEYNQYVPGKLIVSSTLYHWKESVFNAFSFPNFQEDGPAPGLPNYAIGFLYSGNVHGECSINRGPWKKRVSEIKTIDLWPPCHELNWRWWPINDNDPPIKIASVQLSVEHIQKTAIEALDTDSARIEMPNKQNVQDPFIEQILLATKDELERGNPCGRLYGETAAQMLALHLLSKHCTINPRIADYRHGLSKSTLRCVVDYIETNLNQEISLESLSSLADLSSYHFLRLFKQSTGETPLQFIIRCRMEKAKELLAQTDLSVLEIALEVGYESPNHFIHLFKRFTSVTPSHYRKSI